MESRNNQTNRFIKWLVILGDFLLLNVMLAAFAAWHPGMAEWSGTWMRLFVIFCNVALIIGQGRYHTIIHERLPSGGESLRRVVYMVIMWVIVVYLLFKATDYRISLARLLLQQGMVLFVVLLFARLTERTAIKWYRQRGGNTRYITFVGSDPELVSLYNQLVNDPTTGYEALGYYGDTTFTADIERMGSIDDFLAKIDTPEELTLGDELYLCVSHRERDTVMRISRMCDRQMVRFFYVPVSSEAIELNLKGEMINDMQVFTTYENPLQNPLNKILKRFTDIVVASLGLLLSAFLFPLVWFKIKTQSPGSLLFRQQRTGLDGKTFTMLKFRSMHVNAQSDTLQATEEDPRKFPFGNFMRRTNLDEVPQFWNVLRGDMSIVGPRPHMLHHTKVYSKLIDKYMVRHFVKPGMTGWAQVTGYRGETRQLWQMEGRVRRDIWYMEHWSIWLDLRIIWMTIRKLFERDTQAY